MLLHTYYGRTMWENNLIAIFLPKYCDCDLICDFFLSSFFPQQNVMNDLNMTNTILDTFSVKYSFPHFTFLFNCSLQTQEQQIGGVATVHLSNLKKVILSINTRHALFKHCVQNVPSYIKIIFYLFIYFLTTFFNRERCG